MVSFCSPSYLQPSPLWLSVPPCQKLWRQLDSGRTGHTSCPLPSSGERLALQWCRPGPFSADSPESPGARSEQEVISGIITTHRAHGLSHLLYLGWVFFFFLPVCQAGAPLGWGSGTCQTPRWGQGLSEGGGTPPPCSGLPRPEPASRRSSRPASSPPLSHARCSCHWKMDW